MITTTVGCDPGFTVRQALSRSPKSAPEVRVPVRMEIQQFHALIGVSSYTPTVKITNSYTSPIEVTGFQLATSRGVCAGTVPRGDLFPAKIASGETHEVKIWFELPAGIGVTFRQSARLIARYSTRGIDETVSAELLGKMEAAGQPLQ